jgi:hypothetical protein
MRSTNPPVRGILGDEPVDVVAVRRYEHENFADQA